MKLFRNKVMFWLLQFILVACNFCIAILSDVIMYETTSGVTFNWGKFFSNPYIGVVIALQLVAIIVNGYINTKPKESETSRKNHSKDSEDTGTSEWNIKQVMIVVVIFAAVIFVPYLIAENEKKKDTGDVSSQGWSDVHIHSWAQATYTNAKTCNVCGKTEGDPVPLNVGDIIALGKYEQDCNMSNGAEDIQWMVLDIQGDHVFLITQDCIEVLPYHTDKNDVTWELCTLRSWLNNTFYNSAFTPSEQAAIVETYVDNSRIPDYNTSGGADTRDYLYLLSVPEVQYYFSQPGVSRESRATAYTLDRGAGSLGKSEYWWTRTTGNYQNTARVVDSVDTKIFPEGDNVGCVDNVVRPVMWIDLSAL